MGQVGGVDLLAKSLTWADQCLAGQALRLSLTEISLTLSGHGWLRKSWSE